MLKKLIKHELKNSIREFAIVCGLIIFLGVCWGVAIISKAIDFTFATGFLIIILIITCIVLLGKNLVNSYEKKIFSRQGYLTLTLPVNYHQIIISKIVSMLIMITACCLSVFLAVLISALISGEVYQTFKNENLVIMLLFYIKVVLYFIFYSILYFGIKSTVWNGKDSKRMKDFKVIITAVIAIWALSLFSQWIRIIPFSLFYIDGKLEIIKISSLIDNFGSFISFSSLFWHIIMSVGVYFLFIRNMSKNLEIDN